MTASKLIPHQKVLLLDGATGTELGHRGADISLPLWSARAIIDSPELLAQIHREYLEAGAVAIIANTFRTHRRSLEKASIGDRAEEFTAKAVELACRVRDQVNPDAKVFGSVAPLEDCYEPELAPTAKECAQEHGEMIRHLLKAGVDAILIETMNNQHEALAAAREANDQVPDKWMISFCTTSEGPPGTLLDGESLVDLIPSLKDSQAIGVNCIPAARVEAEVKLLRQLAPENIRIMAYANVGRQLPDGKWVESEAINPDVYADYAVKWVEAGATIIGGCCGTTPETIRSIAQRLV